MCRLQVFLELTGILKAQRSDISMDGIGNWRDNVIAEHSWRGVKFQYESIGLPEAI